jgi:hypothetical protein
VTYEEAIALRERASFSAPVRVDWARVEEACEVIARRHIETQRAEHPAYDVAARRGGCIVAEHPIPYAMRERDDAEGCPDEAPPGWAQP